MKTLLLVCALLFPSLAMASGGGSNAIASSSRPGLVPKLTAHDGYVLTEHPLGTAAWAAAGGGITLGTANGLSLSVQVLSLGAASASAAGAMTTGTQTLAGAKTFSGTMTLTLAPVFTDASGTRTALALGTLATQNGTFSGTSSGTNTGDQTNITGNAATVTTIPTLSGDVTNSGNAVTVATVAASTAANVHAAELLANAAVSTNTASTIVKRDGSGNFTAGTITAALTGNATTATTASTVTTNANLSGDVSSSGNTTTIGSSKVTSAMIVDATIVSGDIANSTIDLTTKVTGALPIANGGTGSGTQPFVDLTTAQNIAGVKTLSAQLGLAGTGSITAGTNSQGGATLLTAGSNIYIITAGAGDTAVTMFTPVMGQAIFIVNDSGTRKNIFPGVGHSLSATNTANASIAIERGCITLLIPTSVTSWRSGGMWANGLNSAYEVNQSGVQFNSLISSAIASQTTITATTYIERSRASTITASTTQTQGQGAMTTDIGYITTCANVNDVVTLPALDATYSHHATLRNDGAQIAQIFPASGGKICMTGSACGSTNASTTLAVNAVIFCDQMSSTVWACR